MEKTEDVLKDTEFSYLIEKFKLAGNDDMQSFMVIYNQGKLLDYLKNFEKDETKVLLLQNIIKKSFMKTSKLAVNIMGILFIIVAISIVYLIFSVTLG